MASGSYWWTAWVDGHITLQGDVTKLQLSFDKVRSGIRPDKKLTLRLREEDFWFEVIGIDGKRLLDKELDTVFDTFGSDKVRLSYLADNVSDTCSRNTLESLIKKSPKYFLDKTDKRCFYVVKKSS